MYMNWQLALTIAAGFVCFVTAIEKLQDIIKKFRAPTEDVEDKLKRDFKRINDLEKDMEDIKETLDYVRESMMLQMETDMVICEHMRTNNSTGKIKAREEAINQFLLKHQSAK